MSSPDPFPEFAHPHAQDGAADDSGRSVRAAGRALTVGALGLSAAAVFTGTGLAAEGDSAGDTDGVAFDPAFGGPSIEEMSAPAQEVMAQAEVLGSGLSRTVFGPDFTRTW